MKTVIAIVMLLGGTFISAQERMGYTIKPWNDKAGNSYVSVVDPEDHRIKNIKVYGYPERSIVFNDNHFVFVVSYEVLTKEEIEAVGSVGLKRLYRIDLTTGKTEIVDYCTPIAAISADYKYVMYSYSIGDTGISNLQTKKIGTKIVLWDISAKRFDGLVKPDDGFTDITIIEKRGDECILLVGNQVNSDIYVKMRFDSDKYEIIKDYKPKKN